MKIYEFCPFNNENLVAKIKIAEHSKWLDELHITEANKTFTYLDKPFFFDNPINNLTKYHQIDVNKKFKKNGYGFSKSPWFVKFKNRAWFNESFQRNTSCSWIRPDDSDIVILSDIDEILDYKRIDEVIDKVKQHQIVTVRLHFTLFYFNLFSKNWSGAPDYSYRVFVMTGKYFNELKISSDKLRKLGESGALINQIYCLDGFSGFHHSWLGDRDFVVKKIKSYAHAKEDHDPLLFNYEGNVNVDYVESCMRNCQSLFGEEHLLYKDPDICLFDSVNKIRDSSPEFFVD